jgi:glutaconate CoA-transferase subunit A
VALLTLEEAVSDVADGSQVLLGNFGAQLFAVGHELVRQGKRDLHIVAGSGGILLDQLLHEGIVRAATVAHCWNPVGPATARGWRSAVESGRLQLTELSLGALSSALLAGAWGVPFMPTTDLEATGYRTDHRANGLLDIARCSLGETTVVAALQPDVAFIHVDRATADGDGWVSQPGADVTAAAMAARQTVLIAEELSSDPRAWGPCTIPGAVTRSVAVRPGAVYPDGALGRYPRDITAYQDYARLDGHADGIAEWRRRIDRASREVASGR